MTGAFVSVHIPVGGVAVEHHCDHDDGASSYRIEHDGEGVTVYLYGTPEQLGRFAEAVVLAATEQAIAEATSTGKAVRS